MIMFICGILFALATVLILNEIVNVIVRLFEMVLSYINVIIKTNNDKIDAERRREIGFKGE